MRPPLPANPSWLERLKTRGYLILQGAEVTDYLNARGANAATFGCKEILLRDDPRAVEVLEEFLHNVQVKLGMLERYSRTALERHVKEFMLRHQRLLKLGEADVQWLQEWLKKEDDL